MHDPSTMSILEDVGDNRGKLCRFAMRQPGPLESPGQIGAVDVLGHNEEREFARAAHVVNGNDVGMLETGHRARFGQVQLGLSNERNAVRMRDLHGNRPIELLVASEINDAETPLAQDPFDPISTDPLRQSGPGRRRRLGRRFDGRIALLGRRIGGGPFGKGLRAGRLVPFQERSKLIAQLRESRYIFVNRRRVTEVRPQAKFGNDKGDQQIVVRKHGRACDEAFDRNPIALPPRLALFRAQFRKRIAVWLAFAHWRVGRGCDGRIDRKAACSNTLAAIGCRLQMPNSAGFARIAQIFLRGCKARPELAYLSAGRRGRLRAGCVPAKAAAETVALEKGNRSCVVHLPPPL